MSAHQPPDAAAAGRWRLLLLLLCAPASAPALDYQWHGFVAQGFVLSEGNNLFGSSTDGSFNLYEAGLNGTVSLRPDLLVSAQALVRDAGETDNEGLRLDYALVDYRFLSTPSTDAGVRLGRVKNAFGLYNETRDIIFTRPGITLPHSIYLESQGFRRILFSSDGGQLYGGFTHGEQYTSVALGISAQRHASDDEKRQLLPPGVGGEVNFDDFLVARLQSESAGGTWRYGLSYLTTRINFDADPGIPFDAHLDIDLYVLSLRHNAARYALTAEYELMKMRGEATGFGRFDDTGDGAYIQLDYRLTPNWTLAARHDASFSDRGDRDGRDYAAATGANRHSRFAHDTMLGLNWQADAHWGVWSEFHWIDGTSSVSSADNAGRTPDPHWNVFLLMAGYRF
jgi:hypothetical protein